MIDNETNIHLSSKKVVVSKYRQPHGLQQWENTNRLVGYKWPRNENMKKVNRETEGQIENKTIYEK